MNSQTFVARIKVRTVDSAVDGVMKTLHRPPGRRPEAELKALSEWFHQMPEVDRQKVEAIARYAADLAVYNFLGVLDGIAFFDLGGSSGKFELYYNDGESRTLLNDDKDEQLTSLFKDAQS